MLVFCSLQVVVAEDVQHAPKETDKSKSIFNGKDLTGWSGDSRLWSVRDGAIHGETTADLKTNGNTFIIWQDGKVEDFELRLSFRCSRENNSGIQYRSEKVTEGVKNDWVVTGYQHEIRNSHEFPSVAGFIYGERLAGRGRICLVGEKAVAKSPKEKEILGQLITQQEFNELFKLDDWNDVVIVAKGNHIQHYMNDRLILDFTDGKDFGLTEGIVALQLHAGVPMWVDFKDIRLTALD
ncbi:MAG: DUF1080 domain-containing protein [Planctomycetales bacterium]|nr:DUF1080 domain-containing protein [Planctomycetales bacterium]